MSTDEVFEAVRVERPAVGGGVGRVGDGRVVFVRHALVGELVRVAITETTAKYLRGDAVEVLEASAGRVAAPCPYAHAQGCGGCDLQHASPAAQLSWKASLVSEQLRRVAGVAREVVVEAAPSPAQGSRTRLRCVVNDEGKLGLRGYRSHDVKVLDECWIGSAKFAEAFAHRWRGYGEVELRALGDGVAFAVAWREGMRGSFFELRTLTNQPLDPTTVSRVDVAGNVFSVSPGSFWQSHVDAPGLLSAAVLEGLAPAPGDHVVDLFAGVGLFSLPLARAVGARGRVTAVESNPNSVRDARVNLEGLAPHKVRQWQVTPRSVADAVHEGDLVVLDPPRTGLARGVAAAIAKRAPRRVVYVSCDAATFARDVASFAQGGFALREMRAIDLFPMTEHVELVALLDSAL
ncbi:MAG: class I SAM-dependent RNA methyltransferase [Acidobacteriota bacterium]|nr:class I SAM-dependent RNA methyltransferase [Acidobacteriota bacterium]